MCDWKQLKPTETYENFRYLSRYWVNAYNIVCARFSSPKKTFALFSYQKSSPLLMCDWNRMKPIRISDIWVDIESTLTISSLKFCGRYTFQFSEKKLLPSIKRGRKKLSPSSKKSWLCVGNYATLLSWLLSPVPRLPWQHQVTATAINSLDLCRR